MITGVSTERNTLPSPQPAYKFSYEPSACALKLWKFVWSMSYMEKAENYSQVSGHDHMHGPSQLTIRCNRLIWLRDEQRRRTSTKSAFENNQFKLNAEFMNKTKYGRLLWTHWTLNNYNNHTQVMMILADVSSVVFFFAMNWPWTSKILPYKSDIWCELFSGLIHSILKIYGCLVRINYW